MTTGSPVQNRQLPRQPAAAPALRARAQSAPPPARAMQPVVAILSGAAADDELQMNLADIPRTPAGLHVDGFAPSLTSRLIDFFARLRQR